MQEVRCSELEVALAEARAQADELRSALNAVGPGGGGTHAQPGLGGSLGVSELASWANVCSVD